MASLVFWKKKTSKYRDENDDDDVDIKGPRLVDSINEATFIRKDSVNAKAMEKLGLKW